MRISKCNQNFNPGDEVTVKFHNGSRNKGTIIREVITAVSEICARWYVVQFKNGFQDTIISCQIDKPTKKWKKEI